MCCLASRRAIRNSLRCRSKPRARNGRPPARSVPESDGGATTRGNKATTGQCRLTIAVIPVESVNISGPDPARHPGAADSRSGRPIPSARAFLERSYLVDGVQALRHQAGVFYRYEREFPAYREQDEATIRAGLYAFLEQAVRWIEPDGEQAPNLTQADKAKVENVLDCRDVAQHRPDPSPSASVYS